jgi:hypothetical protein
VYQIQEQDINEIERKMKDKNLKAIHGTMKIHPLTTEQSEEVKHRQISCVCCLTRMSADRFNEAPIRLGYLSNGQLYGNSSNPS